MPQPLMLQELRLKNFLSHEDTRLSFDKAGIVWVHGNLGDGKSALRDAIEFLFLATARGLTRKESDKLAYDPTVLGRPAEAEVRKMGVRLRALVGDASHEFTRSRSDESHTKTHIASLLGVPDLDILEAVLDAGSFIRRDREERLRLLDRVLGQPLTDAELQKAGIDDPEVRRMALKSVKSGQEKAAHLRRDLERDLPKDLPEAPADPVIEALGKRASEIDPVALGQRIEQATLQRNALAAEIERVKGVGEGQVKALEQLTEDRKAALPAKKAAVAAAEKLLSDLHKSSGARAAKQAAEDATNLVENTKPYRQELDTLKTAAVAAKVTLDAAKADLARALKAKDGPCPLCAGPLAAADLVALRKSQVQKALDADDEVARNIADLEKQVDRSASEERRLQAVVNAHAAAVSNAESAVERAKEDLAVAQGEIADAERMVCEAKTATAKPEVVAAKAEELAKADARLSKANDALRVAREYRTAVEAHKALAGDHQKARDRAARYAQYEAILGEDGILATRTAGGIALLQQKVAEFSAKACPAGMTVALNEQAAVLFNGVEVSRASEGQAWLAGAVVAAAIANLSGLRFLFLDGMSALDADARDRMFRLLYPLVKAGDLTQVFVVTLRDRVGWCDGCGGKAIRESNGMCAHHPEFPVTALRPVGSMVGVVRIFEFVRTGVMKEVLPLPVKA